MENSIWEMWIEQLVQLNNNQLDEDKLKKNYPPHCSNIIHQLQHKGNGKDEKVYKEIIDLYLKFRKSFEADYEKKDEFIESVVKSTNEYLDFFIETKFSHRSDFASSIIPEMFYLLSHKIIEHHKVDLFVTSQGDIVIECMFDLENDKGRVILKTKRVDVAIVKNNQFKFNDTEYEFYIPIVAIEVKTNLDKNMLSGIENSVQSLKKTFPKCLYYAIAELSDFKLELNYASSDIDEMYILRKQKRAETRKDSHSRKSIDINLIKEIIDNIENKVLSAKDNNESIVDRMNKGKLIGRG